MGTTLTICSVRRPRYQTTKAAAALLAAVVVAVALVEAAAVVEVEAAVERVPVQLTAPVRGSTLQMVAWASHATHETHARGL